MDLKLKGKTALVTGGSEGIGKGIARAFAKEGVDVAICARRKEPLEATANEIARETGRKIVAIPADLRKDADARNFIEQGAKALGRIDIMVNNAGSAAGGVIEHLSEDDWEKGLQLKFMAPRERNDLIALVKRLVVERKTSVLFTEHSMDVVFAFADRIIVLARGRLIANGDAAAIREHPQVREVYFGTGTATVGAAP